MPEPVTKEYLKEALRLQLEQVTQSIRTCIEAEYGQTARLSGETEGRKAQFILESENRVAQQLRDSEDRLAQSIRESEARKADVMREMESRLVRAFENMARSTEIRFRRLEATQDNNTKAVELRLAMMEAQILEVQVRLTEGGL